MAFIPLISINPVVMVSTIIDIALLLLQHEKRSRRYSQHGSFRRLDNFFDDAYIPREYTMQANLLLSPTLRLSMLPRASSIAWLSPLIVSVEHRGHRRLALPAGWAICLPWP